MAMTKNAAGIAEAKILRALNLLSHLKILRELNLNTIWPNMRLIIRP